MDLVNIFIRSAFVDNMIFAFFFGMCSYLAVSKTVKTAFGLGMAVIFVLVVTIPINYLIENYVLKEGALSWLGKEFSSVNLSYLTFIMFIAVIASTVIGPIVKIRYSVPLMIRLAFAIPRSSFLLNIFGSPFLPILI